jgi:hypothetical protein
MPQGNCDHRRIIGLVVRKPDAAGLLPQRVVERRVGILEMYLYRDRHLGLVRLSNEQLGLRRRDVAQAYEGEVVCVYPMLCMNTVKDHSDQGQVDEEGQSR